MKLEFSSSSLDRYKLIKESDPGLALQIKEVLSDALLNPTSGLGSPTPLVGEMSSKWTRYITRTDFLIYSFDDDCLKVELIEADVRASKVNLENFSKEEEEAVMALMAGNRGRDNEPKVGIFWYNRAANSLFGVVSHRVSDYSKANASGGRITCSEMHEDVWKKEFRRQKYQGDGSGPFIGAYQDKPRGRVFFNIDGTFEVAVGKWLEEYPQAYELILEEFDLPAEKTSAKYAVHWDIGQSWR